MMTPRPAGDPDRGRAVDPARLAWAAALLAVGLTRLGGAPLFDVDEGAFSEATREMLEGGDWGHTTLNGEPRWDKPILTYWLQALSVSAFGLGEFALRLPSVLATWAWALSVMTFARPRWGWEAALLSSAIVVTCVGVMAIGRAATADALLNLWITLASLDLWRHLEGVAGGMRTQGPLRRAGLWVGLGLLTKGPVAMLVPGAAALIFVLTSVPPGARMGRLRGLVGDGVAWAIMAAVALPWYAYALQRHGMAFVEGFLLRHNLQRYGGTLEGHGGSAVYYLVVLPILMLPWTPLLCRVVLQARSLWTDGKGPDRFLLVWAGFVVAFFSLSGTKLPHYALYGMTPLALLAGRVGAGASGSRGWWVQAGLVILLPGGAVAATWAALAHAGSVADGLYRALLGAPAPLAGLAWTACGAMAAMAAVILGLRRASEGPAAPVRLAGAALLMAIWVHAALVPWWGERLQGPILRAAAVARQEAARAGATGGAVQWGVHLPSFAVHREASAPRRAPRPGEMALVRADQIDRLAAGGRWSPLFEERGIRLIRWEGVGEVPR
jgi:4-amino-4-deoxy-L-arabinose transferase-like glycosyltransferase